MWMSSQIFCSFWKLAQNIWMIHWWLNDLNPSILDISCALPLKNTRTNTNLRVLTIVISFWFGIIYDPPNFTDFRVHFWRENFSPRNKQTPHNTFSLETFLLWYFPRNKIKIDFFQYTMLFVFLSSLSYSRGS